MANTGARDSGGSQFFVNVVHNRQLDWFEPELSPSKHTVFGRTTPCPLLPSALSSLAPCPLPPAPSALSGVGFGWLSSSRRVHVLGAGVVEGTEVVLAISRVQTDADDRPRRPIRITALTVSRPDEAQADAAGGASS